LKNFECFRASVYARAQARGIQRRERRRKVRNASLSAAMIALALVMAVPVVRTGRKFAPEAVAEPELMQEHTVESARQPGEPPPSRMVLLMGVPGGGAAEVVVLDSNAKQKSFVSQYKEDNHMPAEADPSLTAALEAPKTVHSTGELTEFLQELPRTNDSMQLVISDYDEDFFASNVLCCVPLDIAPADFEDLGLEEDHSAARSGQGEDETFPETTHQAAASTTLPEGETALPPPPTQLAEESLREHDVKVLLLVPMQKAQGQMSTEIPS